MVSAVAHPRFLADRNPDGPAEAKAFYGECFVDERLHQNPAGAFARVVTDLVVHRPVRDEASFEGGCLCDDRWLGRIRRPDEAAPSTFATLLPAPQIPHVFGLPTASLLAASVVLLIHDDPNTGPRATIYEAAAPAEAITLKHRPGRVVFSLDNEAPRYWLDALDLRRDLGPLEGSVLRFGPQGLLVDALNSVNFLGMQFRYVTNTASQVLAATTLPSERRTLLRDLEESMREFRDDLRKLSTYRGYLESTNGQLGEIREEQLEQSGWNKPDLIERLMRLRAARELDSVIERFRRIGATPDTAPFPLGELVMTHDELCAFGTLPRIFPLTCGDLQKGETLDRRLEKICAHPDLSRILSSA